MDNYKEYLEERMNGMYGAFDSVVMEEFKKNKDKKDMVVIREGFMQYLDTKYPNDNVRQQLRDAKTVDDQVNFVKKYEKDYAEWESSTKFLNKIAIAQVVNSVLLVLNITSRTSFIALSVVLFGVVVGKMVKDHNDKKNN